MLNAFFYSHNIWTVAFAVCCVTVVLPLIGLYFFHRVVDWNVREEDTSMVGLSYALCGGIFAVVLAFVAVGAYETMDRTSEVVGTEANSLSNLVFETAGLPEADGAKIRSDINTYIDIVVQKEWPHQQAYEMDEKNFDEGWNQIRRINTDIANYEPSNAGQAAVNGDMVRLINDLFSARRARQLAASSHLPDAIWQMLIVGLLLVAVFIYLFGPHSFKVHVLTTGLTMLSIGLIFTLIIALDYPFRGSLSVSDEAYVGVKEVGEHTFEKIEAREKAEGKNEGAVKEGGPEKKEAPAAKEPAKKE